MTTRNPLDAIAIRESWMADAARRGLDPSLFIPERGERDCSAAAKAVCVGCPTAAECFDYGVRLGAREPGVYGGTTGRERRQIRDERRRRAS